MDLQSSRWDLLTYKLRHVGLATTLRVAWLDLEEVLAFRLSKRFPGLRLSPRSIQIECTTRCNLKCSFCELSYWTEKAADLRLDDVRRLVEHLPRLRRLDLTGIGESLMNRQFFDIVGFLKGRGIYVTLNDNFTLLTEKTARRLVALGVDQIFLSLDGATPETYEAIRVNANFEKVIANARRLVAVRRESRGRRPEVKINTVVCSENYRELPAIVELAADIGIGMVQFVNVMTFEETSGLDTAGVRRDVEQSLQEAVRRARRLGVRTKVELFDKIPVQQCDYPWRRNFVTYDGLVHPCCYTTQTGDRRAQNRRAFGNLIEQPFAAIWSGPMYAEFRGKMARGILPFQCGLCPKYSGATDTVARPGRVLPLLEEAKPSS